MVSDGTVRPPTVRSSTAASSLLVTTRSVYGTPRCCSRRRPLSQGTQSGEVYSVTGWRCTAARNSCGNTTASGGGAAAEPSACLSFHVSDISSARRK